MCWGVLCYKTLTKLKTTLKSLIFTHNRYCILYNWDINCCLWNSWNIYYYIELYSLLKTDFFIPPFHSMTWLHFKWQISYSGALWLSCAMWYWWVKLKGTGSVWSACQGLVSPGYIRVTDTWWWRGRRVSIKHILPHISQVENISQSCSTTPSVDTWHHIRHPSSLSI